MNSGKFLHKYVKVIESCRNQILFSFHHRIQNITCDTGIATIVLIARQKAT